MQHDRFPRRPIAEDVPVATQLGLHHGIVQIDFRHQRLVYTAGRPLHGQGIVVQIQEEIRHPPHRRQSIGRAAKYRRTDPAIGRGLRLQPLGLTPHTFEPGAGGGNRNMLDCVHRLDEMARRQRALGIPHRAATRRFQPRNSTPRRGKRNVIVASHGPIGEAVLVFARHQIAGHIFGTDGRTEERLPQEFDGKKDLFIINAHRRPGRSFPVPEAFLKTLNALADLGLVFHRWLV